MIFLFLLPACAFGLFYAVKLAMLNPFLADMIRRSLKERP